MDGIAYLLALLIGVTAGTTSGLLGVGGGIVLIPLMTMVLKLDFKQAVAASLVVIIPSALSGIVGHWRENSITQWPLLIVIILGAIAGAQLGVYLCHWLDVGTLKKIFGLLLICVAMKFIL